MPCDSFAVVVCSLNHKARHCHPSSGELPRTVCSCCTAEHYVCLLIWTIGILNWLSVLPTLRLLLWQCNLFISPLSKLCLKVQYGLWLSEKTRQVFKDHHWFLFNSMSFPDSVYFWLLALTSFTLGFIRCSVCSRCLLLLMATSVFAVTRPVYIILISVSDF